jgi:hypothetical protein
VSDQGNRGEKPGTSLIEIQEAPSFSVGYILKRFKKDNLIKLSLSLGIMGLFIIAIAEISDLQGDLGTIALTIGATFIVSGITPLIVSLDEVEYRKLFDEAMNRAPKDHEKIESKENQIITSLNDLISANRETNSSINQINKLFSIKEKCSMDSKNEIISLKANIDSLNNNVERKSKQFLETINNGMKRVEDALITNVDLAEEASMCGIVHIFRCRHNNEIYEKEILKQMKSVGKNQRVSMMANSFREFFGTARHKHREVILDMLNKNIFFKIILLDPLSEAAINRAFVEEGKRRENYLSSSLFVDIESISFNLNKLISDNKKAKTNIEVRFSPFAPTTYLIATDKYTFIEQYHNGGDQLIKDSLAEKNMNCDCFGGFAPIIMYNNSSFFARLIKSHFENTWNSELVSNRDLVKNDYYKEILEFKKNFR